MSDRTLTTRDFWIGFHDYWRDRIVATLDQLAGKPEANQMWVVKVEELEQWWTDHAYTPDDVVVPDHQGRDTSVDLTDLYIILFGKPEDNDVLRDGTDHPIGG